MPLTDLLEFLCAIELFFTYLIFWRDENRDGAPVSLVRIHLRSLPLAPFTHQGDGINLLDLDIFAEERAEMSVSDRYGLTRAVLPNGFCPYNPMRISRIIKLINLYLLSCIRELSFHFHQLNHVLPRDKTWSELDCNTAKVITLLP